MTPALVGLELLGVVAEAYADDPSVTRTLVPGQITTDDWCWSGCGTAYVRLDAAYPSTVFPIPDTSPGPCTAPLATRWNIGIHRCVSGVDNSGNPPSAEAQTEDALALLDDMHRLLCGIRPFVKEHAGRGGALLGSWTPIGPLGDCAGGFWPVTLRM